MAKFVKTQVEIEGKWHEQEVVVEKEAQTPWGREKICSIVGKPIPRVDGYERVTGTAKYTYDVHLPGMLTAKIVRSPHPHARLLSLDTSRAEALPGVRGIITKENIPSISWFSDSFLFDDHIRFEGEEIAAVAADSEEIAEQAVSLVTAEFEKLPFLFDHEQALTDEAPKLHESGNEAAPAAVYQRGDCDKGTNEADIVIEKTYRTKAALHNSLETHGSVAMWEGDKLTVWDSTQNVFGVRGAIAEKLQIPLNKVRVIKQYIGGGFGSKIPLGKYTILAALLSKKTGKPVKLMLSRHEENIAAGNRPPSTISVTLGAKKDGTLTCIDLRSVTGVGAYNNGGPPIGGPARELYKCENVRTEERVVYTNRGPSTAFRAPGFVEGTFALESTMDEAAHTLKIDPLELRLKNYAEKQQVRNLPYSSKDLDESYKRGAELIGWKDRAARKQEERSGSKHCHPALARSKKRGFGMATQIWGGGGMPPSYALMKVNADGTFDLLTGTQDIGTGTRTVMTQIAAEELGVPLDTIRITLGDTLACPYAVLSAGSLTVPSVGPPVRMAAKKAKEQLLELAASVLEETPDQLQIKNGIISSSKDPSKTITVEKISEKIGNYMIIGKGVRGPNPEKHNVNTFGVHFVELEVDTTTGNITLLNHVAVHEFGRVLNPLTLSSQVEGGIIQGCGFGLFEEQITDRNDGKIVNANLSDYKVPTALDIPEIRTEAIDQVDPIATGIGSKGAGEPPIIPPAAAIANAVYDALGLRLTELPMTPDKILDALHETR